MYHTDDHTDLVIKCGGDLVRMHRSIVCIQSEFLQHAIQTGGFIVSRIQRDRRWLRMTNNMHSRRVERALLKLMMSI
jgi:hypothetical protein